MSTSNGSNFPRDAHQDELRRQIRLNDALFRQAITCFALLDRDFHFLRVNDAFARHYGKRSEDFTGRKFFDIIPYEGAPTTAKSMFDEVLRNKRPLQAVARPYVFADQPDRGTTYWDWILQPILDERGEVESFFFSSIDVTERERAAGALRQTESQLRTLIENYPDFIARFDRECRHLYVSPSVTRGLGIPLEGFVGKTLHELGAPGPPGQNDALEAGIRQAFEHGTPNTLEARWPTPQGERIFEVRHIPERDEQGKVVSVLGLTRDVTERRRAEDEVRASEARFRIFVDHATDAFFLHDADGIVLDVNEQACTSLGYTRDELIGMSPFEFDVDIDRATMAQFAARLEAGEVWSFDTHHRRKDGTVFPVEVRVRSFWEGGRRFGVSLARDFTERKRVEEALRRSEAYLAEAQRLGRSGSWAWNVATREFVHWSQEHYRLHGLDPQQGTPSWEAMQQFIHPDDRARCLEQIERAVQKRQDCEMEYRSVLPDGSIKYVHSISHPVFNAAGELVEFVGTEIDFTDRKQAEEALRQSEAKYRAIFDNAVEGLFQTTPEGAFLSLNPALAHIYGYETPEQVITHFRDIGSQLYVDPKRRQEFTRLIEAHGAVTGFEFEIRRKDGSGAWVSESARAVRDRAGTLLWYEGTVEDITERKRAEQALVESYSLMNAVVEGTADVVFVKDLHSRYLMINSAGASFIDKPVDEIVGKDDRELLMPEAARLIRERDLQVMATGQAQTYEETATAAGVTRTFLTTKSAHRDAQGKVIGLVGIARDVTELKRLEEQFLQSQKMEAVGQLAGGIAHDFNNLLTVINGYSQVVFSHLRAEDPNREWPAQIQKAGERAANLTRQLLAFSRKQVLQPQIVSLNDLLEELHKLLIRLIGEDVELALVQDRDLGLAKVDPGQFEQAIINLAVNARDAMPQGGRLTIETKNAELDHGYADRHAEVRPGRYVLVAVSDTGHGMNASTRARIFEPFFTTKEIGKGTGLGLAMVYGFVKQSGGHVDVYSERGHGTTFKVYLPRAEAAARSAKSSQGALRVPKGSETVLLVEDEDAVRTLSRLILQSNGYTVLEAKDGQEGVRVAQQHPGPIHLLVTDLVMPRMSGRQLANRLTQARPQMRVLFMSGYTDEAVMRHGVLEPDLVFLQKPFSAISLARKVREVLDAKEPRG
jgi:two-component system, cell cycle sensor histidine kinase and response regulator CckA